MSTSPGAGAPRSRLYRLWVPLGLALLALLIYIQEGWASLLEYRRSALLAGEVWRLFSGHWTHASASHLVWDLLPFAALGAVLWLRSPRLYLAATIASALGISLYLLFMGAQWERYRGLSGIDTALFAALATWLWRRAASPTERWLSGGALVLLLAKISYEVVLGAPVFASLAPGYAVVPEAHLIGAVVGISLGVSTRFDPSPPGQT